jgi:hypothetical protein
MRFVFIAKELLEFLWKKKMWWLLPVIVMLILVAVVLIFGQSSVVSTFVYALF